MKHVIQAAMLVLLICLCILGVAALGTFLYVRYGDAPSKVSDVERRMQQLESRPVWRVRWSGFRVSTTDRPQISDYLYDLRLPYGTNTVEKLDGELGKQSGHIVTAWISDWTPRSEMTKFEQLSVSNLGGTRFEILARARTNESVAMECEVTFIIEE